MLPLCQSIFGFLRHYRHPGIASGSTHTMLPLCQSIFGFLRHYRHPGIASGSTHTMLPLCQSIFGFLRHYRHPGIASGSTHTMLPLCQSIFGFLRRHTHPGIVPPHTCIPCHSLPPTYCSDKYTCPSILSGLLLLKICTESIRQGFTSYGKDYCNRWLCKSDMKSK